MTLGSIVSLPIKLLGLNNLVTLLLSVVVFFALYLIVITIMKVTKIIEIKTQVISKVKKED